MKFLVTGGSGFIGTNFTEYLVSRNIDFLNIDINPPKINSLKCYWEKCNILNQGQLNTVVDLYKPTHIIHLAARTDIDGKILEDYTANTEGTLNVLNSVKQVKTVERVVITSTQFVHQFHGLPQNDEDYAPYTVYGESKMIAEKITREANLDCIWTIIRPTNIWGPWHSRYPHEFWYTISKGYYVHPGKAKVIRSYGYVGNVIQQIISILGASKEVVNKRVFYVGDMPINLYDWVNGFSKMQTGNEVLIVPRSVVKFLGIVGDLFKAIDIKFPITSSRYRSMITNNEAPMQLTFDCFGYPPFSLEYGITETVEWLKNYHPSLVKM